MCKNYQNAINAFHRLTLNIPLYAAFRRKISSFIDNERIIQVQQIILYVDLFNLCILLLPFFITEKCMKLDEVEVSV